MAPKKRNWMLLALPEKRAGDPISAFCSAVEALFGRPLRLIALPLRNSSGIRTSRLSIRALQQAATLFARGPGPKQSPTRIFDYFLGRGWRSGDFGKMERRGNWRSKPGIAEGPQKNPRFWFEAPLGRHFVQTKDFYREKKRLLRGAWS